VNLIINDRCLSVLATVAVIDRLVPTEAVFDEFTIHNYTMIYGHLAPFLHIKGHTCYFRTRRGPATYEYDMPVLYRCYYLQYSQGTINKLQDRDSNFCQDQDRDQISNCWDNDTAYSYRQKHRHHRRRLHGGDGAIAPRPKSCGGDAVKSPPQEFCCHF